MVSRSIPEVAQSQGVLTRLGGFLEVHGDHLLVFADLHDSSLLDTCGVVLQCSILLRSQRGNAKVIEGHNECAEAGLLYALGADGIVVLKLRTGDGVVDGDFGNGFTSNSADAFRNDHLIFTSFGHFVECHKHGLVATSKRDVLGLKFLFALEQISLSAIGHFQHLVEVDGYDLNLLNLTGFRSSGPFDGFLESSNLIVEYQFFVKELKVFCAEINHLQRVLTRFGGLFEVHRGSLAIFTHFHSNRLYVLCGCVCQCSRSLAHVGLHRVVVEGDDECTEASLLHTFGADGEVALRLNGIVTRLIAAVGLCNHNTFVLFPSVRLCLQLISADGVLVSCCIVSESNVLVVGFEHSIETIVVA